MDESDSSSRHHHHHIRETISEVVQKIKKDEPPAKNIITNTNFHTRETEELIREYNSNIATGLSSSEIESIRSKRGANSLPEPPRTSVFRMLLRQIVDFMVLILIGSAILSAVFEDDLKSTIVLLVVVIVNVTIGFTQEFKAERALTNLLSSRAAQQKATVVRDSQVKDIPSTQLVPGDIVILEEGDQVPADIRLIEESHLAITESVLTGESEAVEKDCKLIKKKMVPLGDRLNMSYMMTMVSKGRGKGLVVATGIETEVGKNSKALMSKSSRKKTDLQAKLSVLGKWLVLLSIVLCGVFTLIGWLRGFPLKSMIETGVSLAVSVIPEGLVAVTTVTMALGVVRMSKRQAIVRNLPAVEVLGAVSVICSDKTGTLTEGKMRVEEIWCRARTGNQAVSYLIQGPGDQPINGSIIQQGDKQPVQIDRCSPSVELILTAGALCNNASIYKKDGGNQNKAKQSRQPIQPATEKQPLLGGTPRRKSIFDQRPSSVAAPSEFETVGTPTEVALLMAAMKFGLGRDRLITTSDSDRGYRFERDVPFDSERKRMSVVYRTSSGSLCVYAKGAIEFLLPQCSRWAALEASQQGQTVKAGSELSQADIDGIEEQGRLMSGKGMRVLAIACKPIDQLCEDEDTMEKAMDEDLMFVGLIGMIDPPRAQVPGCIKMCADAGISVCMITGDHPNTAACIARQLKLLPQQTSQGEDEGGLILTGTQVDEMSDDQLVSLDPFPCVIARASPDAKLRVLKALQQRDKIVAFIGDGVNDAASIKHSDVGVAMGRSGTDITQQSADIILSDDNFEHIVTAIEEGRRTYDNIFNFTIYLLSCNSAEILIMLGSTALNLPLPFTSIQILFANIIADVPPSLSLGVEPVQDDVMTRMPRDPKSPFFGWKHATAVLLQGLSMSLISMAVFVESLMVEKYPLPRARCLVFVVLVMIQLVHAFLSRSYYNSVFKTGVIGNKWLLAAFVFSAGALIGGIYIPGFNVTLDLVPLGAIDWAKVAAAVLVHSIAIEGMKIHIRRRRRRTEGRNKLEKRGQV